MITFETDAHIKRPVESVFDFVSDPLNFPQWNSAVQEVRHVAGTRGEVGANYVMERELPGGRAENLVEVVAFERPREFAVRTTSGPTPLLYRYHFAGDGDGTGIVLDAAVELQGVAALVGPLAARAVKRGVDDNLARLKALLEGSVPSS